METTTRAALHKAIARLARASRDERRSEERRRAATLAVGSALRVARLARKLRQRAVARDLGCTPAFLCECEYGRRRLSDEMLGRYLALV